MRGRRILLVAAISRITVILLQAISRLFLPDHTPDVFRSTSLPPGLLSTLLSGLTRWDGQYFIHIATYGYTYENCLAFYPLYPMLVRSLASLVSTVSPSTAWLHLVVVSSTTVNLLTFTLSAYLLHRLTLSLHPHRHRLAASSTILFCFNPASIFFTASYSESLFFLLTLSFLILIERDYVLASALPLSLATLTRSNGLTLLGYLAYRLLLSLWRYIPSKSWYLILRVTCRVVAAAVLSVVPLAIYHVYVYRTWCVRGMGIPWAHLPPHVLHYGKSRGYKLSPLLIDGAGDGYEVSAWCNNTIPLSYGYIQSHYWGVGFLNYYELKQVPQFILACPVVFLCVWGVRRTRYTTSTSSHHLVPYLIHLVFLTLFSLLFIHVQVTTRLIFSSTPLIYWLCAVALRDRDSTAGHQSLRDRDSTAGHQSLRDRDSTAGHQSLRDRDNTAGHQSLRDRDNTAGHQSLRDRDSTAGHLQTFIYAYFTLYYLVGTVLHAGYYPWT